RSLGPEESLIQERCKNCDNGDNDKRADAIKLVELRKVMKEKFYDGGAEQAKTRVAHSWNLLADANDKHQQREQCPGDAIAHISGEISRELKRQRGRAGRAEVIGDLDVHD